MDLNQKERNIVEALIINKNKEILLQKKTFDYPKAPGQWTLFGGEIEEKEDPKNAIIRELKEELGINIENPTLFKKDNYELIDINGKKYFGDKYVFIVNFDDISKIKLSEGAGFAFFNSSELNSLDIHPICRKTINEYSSI